MIAGRLTHRAAVERNVAAGSDDWGGDAVPDFQSIGDPLPCFIWSNRSRELADGAKNALIEDTRGLFALGADIREKDEITSVTDRKGVEIIAGRLKVEGKPQFKHTHIEVALQRIA